MLYYYKVKSDNSSKSIHVSSDHSIATGMSGRYARALFELAQEQNKLDEIKSDLDSFASIMAESDDFTRLVISPIFSAEEQNSALNAILPRTNISDISVNFFKLVARNRRLFAIERIIADYNALLAKHRGEVTAYVSSASQLDEMQLTELKNTLKQAVGQDIQVEATVDPSLLGGLVVKVGSRMIDDSLKTKLDSLKNAMKEVG